MSRLAKHYDAAMHETIVDSEVDNLLVNNVGINTTVPGHSIPAFLSLDGVGNFYFSIDQGPKKYFGTNQHGSISIKLRLLMM